MIGEPTRTTRVVILELVRTVGVVSREPARTAGVVIRQPTRRSKRVIVPMVEKGIQRMESTKKGKRLIRQP